MWLALLVVHERARVLEIAPTGNAVVLAKTGHIFIQLLTVNACVCVCAYW